MFQSPHIPVSLRATQSPLALTMGVLLVGASIIVIDLLVATTIAATLLVSLVIISILVSILRS